MTADLAVPEWVVTLHKRLHGHGEVIGGGEPSMCSGCDLIAAAFDAQAGRLREERDADVARVVALGERDVLAALAIERRRVEAAEARLREAEERLEQQRRVAAERMRVIAYLRAQVARWEAKEVQRASCCADNEQRAARLEEALREIVRYRHHPEAQVAEAALAPAQSGQEE